MGLQHRLIQSYTYLYIVYFMKRVVVSWAAARWENRKPKKKRKASEKTTMTRLCWQGQMRYGDTVMKRFQLQCSVRATDTKVSGLQHSVDRLSYTFLYFLFLHCLRLAFNTAKLTPSESKKAMVNNESFQAINSVIGYVVFHNNSIIKIYFILILLTLTTLAVSVGQSALD